jgi:hypothetical protein
MSFEQNEYTPEIKTLLSDVITFPVSVFETADTKEDLEDWLLSQNPEFLRKMRKARKDDIEGKGKNWESLKKELCIK